VRSLSLEERLAFIRDGFLVVPGVVDQRLVDATLRAINHWIDDGYKSDDRVRYHSQGFAPELRSRPVVMDLLLASGAFETAGSLVGRAIERPASGQVALRFPAGSSTAGAGPRPHIDGVATATNGVPDDGQLHGFTLLAGVLLSDLSEPGNGNFTVWPGTHLSMARWLTERGTRFSEPLAFVEAVEDVATKTAKPHAVTGRAGDLVLAHYLLLHGVGRHLGPAIRYIVFFRLTAERHDELGTSPYTDPWCEWDALRAAERGRAGPTQADCTSGAGSTVASSSPFG
jgi:hypothetical protein